MKQLFTAVLIAAMISISLVGCTVSETEEPAITDEVATDDIVTEEPVVMEEATENEVAEKFVYTNESCGFSLTFPETWGEVEAAQEGETESTTPLTLTLTSKNNSNLILKLDLIRGDHSPEGSVRVGKTEKCYIYLSADMEAESLKEVTDSFVEL